MTLELYFVKRVRERPRSIVDEQMQPEYTSADMGNAIAAQEGKRFLAENEQLKQNKEAAIPAEIDKRCLKTINWTFAKRR